MKTKIQMSFFGINELSWATELAISLAGGMLKAVGSWLMVAGCWPVMRLTLPLSTYVGVIDNVLLFLHIVVVGVHCAM